MREALNRLQAKRLVTAESLRGFRVSSRSLAEFVAALDARLLIETEALRLSIERGNDAREASVVAARVDGDLDELNARHHAFDRTAGGLRVGLADGFLRPPPGRDHCLRTAARTRAGMAT